MFTNVIVKTPGKSYLDGLTISDLGKPVFDTLIKQHEKYVEALEKCGVTVTQQSASEEFPDSTFVEDAAVLTKDFAVIANPGAPSRNGEIIEIEKVLKNFFNTFYKIEAPGTLDGGDVLQADNHFYIGISERTNKEGAHQLKEIVELEGFKATIIPLKEFFHLKTGIAYLGNNQMVVAGEFVNHQAFESYEKIVIAEEDEYSANCIQMNDYVIIPSGFKETKRKIMDAGYDVIELDMSEVQKHDGGLSCLSLRF